MKAYELLYFVDPTCNEETRAAVMKRIDAFEIDDLTEGDYTLINFHADPTVIAELDRVLRINDAVKRHMVVRRVDKD